jgi:ferredoxin-NADP reductase
MSMLRHRAARASDVPAHVLVSVRSPEDRIYAAELEALEPRSGLRLEWTYTREPPPGWDGWTRRVDAEMLAELGPGPAARPRAYVCGPTPFVEQAATLLVDAGHDPDSIHAERFGPTGG